MPAIPPTQAKIFCRSCGGVVIDPGAGPKQCEQCGQSVFENPIPVVVALVPVIEAGHTGLLVLRRGIEPGRGKLALPGGFLEIETWETGLSREVLEETGLALAADGWTPVSFASSAPRPNRLLVFATCPPVEAAAIPAFAPSAETEALGLVFRPDRLEELMAFPLHLRQIATWFAAHGGNGPTGFHELGRTA
jgi:ADP-ribose pyrophosphatase YjhB (NUDIX family)